MTPELPKFLNEKEVSETLGVALPTLRNARAAGRGLPFHKFGKSVRYNVADVLSFIEKNRVDPSAVPRRGRPGKGDAR